MHPFVQSNASCCRSAGLVVFWGARLQLLDPDETCAVLPHLGQLPLCFLQLHLCMGILLAPHWYIHESALECAYRCFLCWGSAEPAVRVSDWAQVCLSLPRCAISSQAFKCVVANLSDECLIYFYIACPVVMGPIIIMACSAYASYHSVLLIAVPGHVHQHYTTLPASAKTSSCQRYNLVLQAEVH